MRSIKHLFSAFVLVSACAGSAIAGEYGRHGERAYADSFGNLVVISSAGYKRILVGQGWRAEEYAPYSADGNAVPMDHGEVLYSDPQATYPTAVVCAEPRLYRMAPGQSLHVVSGGKCPS